jgi:two-component system CheB/CheR fusion protein
MFEGIVTTFTNTTQAKESYQKLQKASDELNQINMQLEQSNFDLLQFASVASHDLKEPLRKIQTFGNLLHENIKDKIDDKDSNYLEKIIRSANRMQVLIQDILTLSKLSNSDIPYTSVNFKDIIINIIDDLDVSIKEKNVQVKQRTFRLYRPFRDRSTSYFKIFCPTPSSSIRVMPPLITISGTNL